MDIHDGQVWLGPRDISGMEVFSPDNPLVDYLLPEVSSLMQSFAPEFIAAIEERERAGLPQDEAIRQLFHGLADRLKTGQCSDEDYWILLTERSLLDKPLSAELVAVPPEHFLDLANHLNDLAEFDEQVVASYTHPPEPDQPDSEATDNCVATFEELCFDLALDSAAQAAQRNRHMAQRILELWRETGQE